MKHLLWVYHRKASHSVRMARFSYFSSKGAGHTDVRLPSSSAMFLASQNATIFRPQQ